MAALVFNSLTIVCQMLKASHPYLKRKMHGLTPLLMYHKVVTQKDIGNRDVLIVGDIHGCYDELMELLTAAKGLTNGRELYLVCAGDMLNKGPKSLEVLTYLRDLMKEGVASAVKGNHEEAILRQHNSVRCDKNYILPLRYEYLKAFKDADFAFIEQLPYSISIPHLNIIIVHAGLVPGVPLHKQSLVDMCEMRNVDTTIIIPWGRVTTAYKKPTNGVAWASMWDGPQHVYFGHDCRRGLQQLPFATGLDTGCVYGGRLTGVLLDKIGGTHQLLSVPAKCQHYKGKHAKS